jgi:hypothetical protein
MNKPDFNESSRAFRSIIWQKVKWAHQALCTMRERLTDSPSETVLCLMSSREFHPWMLGLESVRDPAGNIIREAPLSDQEGSTKLHVPPSAAHNNNATMVEP